MFCLEMFEDFRILFQEKERLVRLLPEPEQLMLEFLMGVFREHTEENIDGYFEPDESFLARDDEAL